MTAEASISSGGGPRRVDCRVAATYPGGDHTIFLGEVEDAGVLREAEPLFFFRGDYGVEEGAR